MIPKFGKTFSNARKISNHYVIIRGVKFVIILFYSIGIMHILNYYFFKVLQIFYQKTYL